MKAVVFGFSFLISVISFAQTNVIALKSRAGNMPDILKEKDNFGEHRYMNKWNVDTVKFIKKGLKIVEYRKGLGYDTITLNIPENTPGEDLELTLNYIRWEYHPNKTVFIGFPENEQKHRKNNAVSHWFILLLLLLSGGVVFNKHLLRN